jgi:hypothetical protein
LNSGDGFFTGLTFTVGGLFALCLTLSFGNRVIFPSEIALFGGLVLTLYYLRRIILRNRRFEPMVKCLECKSHVTFKEWNRHSLGHRQIAFKEHDLN